MWLRGNYPGESGSGQNEVRYARFLPRLLRLALQRQRTSLTAGERNGCLPYVAFRSPFSKWISQEVNHADRRRGNARTPETRVAIKLEDDHIVA
jgi:hypothetical protein